MASKTVVLVLAVLAMAAAEQRVKKQAFIGAYPYAAAPVVYAEDDGSYFPGKYEGTGYPYAAPYVAAPYAAAPYAAAPYVAAPYAAAPYAAVPYPYVAPYTDDGSYFPGKYGPENQ
ncbi:protein lifeguard 1-like isoform X2 [Macrosteles quadrilineatus]|uniref:protein lifeguard 1-like isoform X2 n=1 Tax=Macrosteles quadrilineatus TaxID=74068 RepID=UPI0023E1FEB7|nr:protein lifeguard 1-like isoform X2 [Macrosteles quadrilineatus]